MAFKLPIVYDIQNLFDTEMKIGKYALKLIRKELKITLPRDEASYIALHFINARAKASNEIEKNDHLIDEVIKIIEKEFKIKVDKNNFNYARFVSHMHYLLKRGKESKLIETTNRQMYAQIQKDYHDTFVCSEKVSQLIKNKLKFELSDEEKLYLMLHINRLCSYEDCNQ